MTEVNQSELPVVPFDTVIEEDMVEVIPHEEIESNPESVTTNSKVVEVAKFEEHAVSKYADSPEFIMVEKAREMAKMLLASNMFKSSTLLESEGDVFYCMSLARIFGVDIMEIAPYIIRIKNKLTLSRQGMSVVVAKKGVRLEFIHDMEPCYTYLDEKDNKWNLSDSWTPPVEFGTIKSRVMRYKKDVVGNPIPVDENFIEFTPKMPILEYPLLLELAKKDQAVANKAWLVMGERPGFNYISDLGDVTLYKAIKDNSGKMTDFTKNSNISYVKIPHIDTFKEVFDGNPYDQNSWRYMDTENKRLTIRMSYKGRSEVKSVTLKECVEAGRRKPSIKEEPKGIFSFTTTEGSWYKETVTMMFYYLIRRLVKEHFQDVLYGIDLAGEDLETVS